MPLKEYVFNTAMSVRAYGTVTVKGTSVEDASSKLTAELVIERFSPHGGNDDIDWKNAKDFHFDGRCYRENPYEDHDIEPFSIDDGTPADPVHDAANDMLAALKDFAGCFGDDIDNDREITGSDAVEHLCAMWTAIKAAIAKAEGRSDV